MRAVRTKLVQQIGLGFTLTELLVVIAIILVLTITALPAVLQSLRDQKFNESARVLQAALAGARDRAIASGEIRGIRLIRDGTDPLDHRTWEVSTLVYVGTPEPYSVGWVSSAGGIVSPSLDPTGLITIDPHFEQADPGPDGKPGRAGVDDDSANGTDDIGELGWPGSDDIPRVDRSGLATIRFGTAGRLYQITGVIPGGTGYALTVPGAPTLPAGTKYQIFNPPAPLPNAPSIVLPEGVVIDVRHSPIRALYFPHPFAGNTEIDIPRSRGIPNQIPPVGFAGVPANNWPRMEILFSPNGNATGLGAISSLIHFWVGERADKGPDPKTSLGADGKPGRAGVDDDGINGVDDAGELNWPGSDDTGPTRPHYLLTLNTRTGSVRVFQNPSTASLDPWPPVPASSYSEIYAPAEQSFGLSKLKLP